MRLTFLIYCARSGSTYLANEIASRFPKVVVVPEFRSLLLLLWRRERQIRQLDTEGLGKLLRRDPQLGNLNFDEQQLKRLLTKVAGCGRRHVILGILQAYREAIGAAGNHYLVKNGQIGFHSESVRELFPEADFLYIRRDPRGVINSMMSVHTIYGYGGAMAGGDPLKAAKLWVRHKAAVCQLEKSRARVYTMRYEALMDGSISLEQSVAPLFSSSEGPPTVNLSSPRTAVVSTKEQTLHPLVGQAANSHRPTAWRQELDPEIGVGIEYFLCQALEEDGYKPYFGSKISESERKRALHMLRFRSRILTIVHAVRTFALWVRIGITRPGQALFNVEHLFRFRSH